ncbi:MAG: SIS domain-containing protein [Candidatus Omnitrophota bacterium]
MNYFKELIDLCQHITINDQKGRPLLIEKAFDRTVQMIMDHKNKGKVFLIGNGGSAAIASHTMTDFIRNAKIPAMAFNDAALLTCMSNDYGYEKVYEKPIEVVVKRGDVLIAISSSGKSKNIIRAVRAAQKNKARVITLSGFNRNNYLSKLGEINFYVPSSSYGFVESIHFLICHCIVDTLIAKKKRKNG